MLCVIGTSDVDKAQELLDFHSDIGGWRVSKYDDDTILPTTLYDIVEFEKIDIPTYQHKVIKSKVNTTLIISLK